MIDDMKFIVEFASTLMKDGKISSYQIERNPVTGKQILCITPIIKSAHISFELKVQE